MTLIVFFILALILLLGSVVFVCVRAKKPLVLKGGDSGKITLLFDRRRIPFNTLCATYITGEKPWFPWVYYDVFKRFSLVKALGDGFDGYLTPKEALEWIEKQPKIPENIIPRVYNSTFLAERNPLFKAFVLEQSDRPSAIDTTKQELPEGASLSVLKWTYNGVSEMLEKYDKFIQLSCVEAYDLLTFGLDKINPKTREYLAQFKVCKITDDWVWILALIPLAHEIENAVGQIRVFGSKMFRNFAEKYKNRTIVRNNFSSKYAALRKRIEEEACPCDITSPEAKLCRKIADDFTYDSKYIASGIYNWRMKTIEEMLKNKLVICHDAAYFAYEKLKEMKVQNLRSLYLRNLDKELKIPGSNHSFITFSKDDGFYTFETGYGENFGVRGPFVSWDEAVRKFVDNWRGNNRASLSETTGKIKPKMNIQDLERVSEKIWNQVD